MNTEPCLLLEGQTLGFVWACILTDHFQFKVPQLNVNQDGSIQQVGTEDVKLMDFPYKRQQQLPAMETQTGIILQSKTELLPAMELRLASFSSLRQN